MANRNDTQGFTIGDGFRFGLGFAIANACVALIGAMPWLLLLAGGLGVMTKG